MTTTRELKYHESTEEIQALENYVASIFELLSYVNQTFHALGIGKLDDIRQLELAIENVDFVKELIGEKGYFDPNLSTSDVVWSSLDEASATEDFDKFVEAVAHFHENKPLQEIAWELFHLKEGILSVNSKEVELRKDQYRYYITDTSKKTKLEAIKQLIEALEEAESLDIKVFNSFDSPIIQKTKKGYKIKRNALD